MLLFEKRISTAYSNDIVKTTNYSYAVYARVLEQWSDGGATPAVTYTIGDDIITEKPGSGPRRKQLLYDGQGSVRFTFNFLVISVFSAKFES